MTRYRLLLGAALLLTAVRALPAQEASAPLVVGTLSTGATVSLIRSEELGEWGIDVSGLGTPHVSRAQPARVEVFAGNEAAGEYFQDDIRQLASGYSSVDTAAGGVIGVAELSYDSGVAFRFEDRWSVSGAVLSVQRTVTVAGIAAGGFLSTVLLSTDPSVTWPDIDYFAPGLLYGDTVGHEDRNAGGRFNYLNRHYRMREDWLPAPLFALSFRDGNSVAILDPAPRGNTTTAETRSGSGTVMIDERYQVGALGATEATDGGVEFGFWLPATTADYAQQQQRSDRLARPLARREWTDALTTAFTVNRSIEGTPAPPAPVWRRRYHPIREGLTQTYQVDFRFGHGEPGGFPGVMRHTWRWAWETLNPTVTPMDVELIRRTLIDQAADRVMTTPDGRMGIPYLLNAYTGDFLVRMDARRAAMGFCAKNIELAEQFLYEAERDPGPRGRRLHELGVAIIDSFVETLPMSPPVGDGFDLFTGQVAPAVWSVGQQFIRTVAEPMLDLMDAYRREQALGTEHPEWLRWAQDFSDWLVTQQRPDGSFPRSWKPGTSEVANPDGSATYAAPPILVTMYQEMGGEAPSAGNAERYLEAAIGAGEYLWATDGTRGRFQGGAVDASSVSVKVDGEAGYLSMRAFLALYEATQHPKWLERAKVAADFTESWVWIWKVPMPADANVDEIHWKPGVSTIGLSSITVASRGTVHAYLSWAAPMYVQLYQYTKDEHYLDVARVLLHGIDPMLELPGRSYGLFLGPGWVQEHWGMSQNRGYGQPGKWLPWLATVRLHAIMGIEQQGLSLLEQLVK